MAGFSTDTGPAGRGLLTSCARAWRPCDSAGQVHFVGHVPYEQLPQYYAGCDVFVAPSLYEPFGMIYLEAMACGKPAVACATGGVPKIIAHGQTGILVPRRTRVPWPTL